MFTEMVYKVTEMVYMVTEMVYMEEVKTMQNEIKENVQGTNSDGKETGTQINNLDQKEKINIQPEQNEETRTQKNGERNLQDVQEAQRVPKKLDSKRNTPRHIIIKLPKIKYKERILEAAREKQLLTKEFL